MASPDPDVRRSVPTGLLSWSVGQGEDGGYSQIRPSTSAGDNRVLVEESERAAASEHVRDLVTSRVVVAVVLGILVAGYALLGFALWVWGIVTLARYHEEPCDQPLPGWLLGMVSWVIVDKACCSNQYNPMGRNLEDNMRDNAWATSCSALIRSVLVGVGLWWFLSSETCAGTSPHMYACVQLYLLWHAVFIVVKLVTNCLLMRLVIFLARNGQLAWLGGNRAARAGLIDELATVEYEQGLFAEEGDTESGKPPKECCICQEDFGPGAAIKRTPCEPVHHYFHKDCLKTWLERYGKTCPICRNDLQKTVGDGV